MANKVEETAVTNQVKEASKDFSALMEKAHADGKAVWQMTSEDRSHLRAPVLVYKDKEGNDKSFYPPVANMLPAVQHQLEIGSKDPRWIPAKEAGANPDIAIRKGAKAVTFVLFTKDKEPYTKKFFNPNSFNWFFCYKRNQRKVIFKRGIISHSTIIFCVYSNGTKK